LPCNDLTWQRSWIQLGNVKKGKEKQTSPFFDAIGGFSRILLDSMASGRDLSSNRFSVASLQLTWCFFSHFFFLLCVLAFFVFRLSRFRPVDAICLSRYLSRVLYAQKQEWALVLTMGSSKASPFASLLVSSHASPHERDERDDSSATISPDLVDVNFYYPHPGKSLRSDVQQQFVRRLQLANVVALGGVHIDYRETADQKDHFQLSLTVARFRTLCSQALFLSLQLALDQIILSAQALLLLPSFSALRTHLPLFLFGSPDHLPLFLSLSCLALWSNVPSIALIALWACA